ncbi:hypothetical protein Gpo141_00007100 [Globisporangium polare]
MVTPARQELSQMQRAYHYKFSESHELQSLNLSRSLGDVCCTTGKWKHQHGSKNVVTPISRADSRISSLDVAKSSLLINLGLAIGLLLVIAVHGVPAEYGGPVAVVATAIAFPSMLAATSRIRYEVVVLLFRSYELWYIFVVSIVTCGLLGVYLGDLRAIVSVLMWTGFFNSSLIDAKTMEIPQTVAVSAIGAVTTTSVLFLVQWGVVPAARHFGVFRYRDHVLCVEDVVVNGLATITIMLVRNAIRRAQDLREQKRMNCTMLRCVSYRCTLKLRLLDETMIQSIVPTDSGIAPKYQRKKHVLNEMIYVDPGVTYDASQTFYPVELDGESWPRWQRLLLATIGFFGMALTILGYAVVNHWTTSPTRWLFAGGLAFTECFCILMWGMSHTKVLRQILFSFDFFFLSFQLSCAHLCACDMFHWDSRCLGMLSSWLWIHFVLTSDALTPVVRKKLTMQTWHLAIPVLLFIIGQVLFACEIVFARHWDLQDRKIHAIAVGNRTIEYRIITFFFSRLATVFLWCLRLLWRIVVALPDDLVMLRGKVAYAYLNDSAGVVGSDVSDQDAKPHATASSRPKVQPLPPHKKAPTANRNGE